MEGYPEGHRVDIYGDGSYTSPTVWWAALGGFGIWVPKWQPEQQHEGMDYIPELAATEDGADGTGQQELGQTRTPTGQELTAWLRVLAIPCRNIYATDSASMMSKALRLIKAAERDLDE